jgi:cytochrome c-type biogenesis protein CcmH/NrfG
MNDFSMDLTAEESRMLESLQSSQPEWQRSMAKRMADTSRERTKSSRTWLARAAAIVLATGGGYLAWFQWFATDDPAALIAKAYTQQRPFKYRIPGAAHSDVHEERSVRSAFQGPAGLSTAADTIRGELQKKPDDVKWLELRARAEMLDRDPVSAISSLRRALERKPDDPDLMADLGMAYALKAETSSNRDIDYGFAIDYLRQSLKAKPDDPIALFNSAVVNEQLFLYDAAIRDWQHYLDLDKAGPWRKEAADRLALVEQKKKSGRTP